MSLLKNSTIIIIGIVVSNGLAYAFHFIAGRLLGPEEYGVMGALMSLFLLIALPAGAIGFATTKYTARFISKEVPGNIYLLKNVLQKKVLIFSGMTFLILTVFSKIIAEFLHVESNVPVIILGISIVFALLLPVNRGILQGRMEFRVYALNLIIESFSRLVLLIIFLALGLGVNGAILAYGLAFLVAFLLLFKRIKAWTSEKLAKEPVDIKPIYRFILKVLFANLIIQAIINVPSLFIKHFYSGEFTGNWIAALNIARISLFISGAVSLVMFPVIAGETNPVEKRKVFIKAVLLVLATNTSIALVFFLVPDLLIHGLYGAQFSGAVKILEGMGVAMIFLGLLQLGVDFYLAKLN